MKQSADTLSPPLSEAELQDMVSRLKRVLNPRRVWVFGSYQRGDWSHGSDVDLLVEMETNLTPAERRVQARRALGPKPCPVDILVYTPDEIEARKHSLGSIIPTILREGRLIG